MTRPRHCLFLLLTVLTPMFLQAQTADSSKIPPICVDFEAYSACGQEGYVMTTRNGPSHKLYGASFVIQNLSSTAPLPLHFAELTAGNGYRTEELGAWSIQVDGVVMGKELNIPPGEQVTVKVRHEKAYEIFPGCHVTGFYALTIDHLGKTYTISAPLNITVEFD